MSDLVRRTQDQQAKSLEQTERLESFVRADQHALELALGERIGVDRFIAAAVTVFRKTPKLAKTTPESRLGALYTAAQLGLEFDQRGLVYVVPYGNEATLVIGYRGFVDLFYRAGARGVDWHIVRDGDLFRMFATGSGGRDYQWSPADGVPDSKRAWTGVIASVETATGGRVWEFMTKAQVLERRPKPIPDPWRKWEEQMALKTVLRQLAKRVQMSTELGRAHEVDESVLRRAPGDPVDPTPRHLPVEGFSAPEPRPSRDAENEPADEDAPPPPPPEEDEEARFERISTEEFNRQQDEAGPV